MKSQENPAQEKFAQENRAKLQEIKKASTNNIGAGTLFFLSFDIVNSTAFKNKKPSKWIEKIDNFYSSVDKGKKKIDESARIWKRQGDEVLIYFTIEKIENIPEKIFNIHDLLNTLITELSSDDGQGILSIKAALWVAYVSTNKPHTDNSDKEYENLNIAIREPKGGFDFIGPDIDFGFRIASHSAGKIICIDPKIIAMITPFLVKNGLELSNCRIVNFLQMKGIWDNRFVPIIWYHPKIYENPDNIFPFDEKYRNDSVRKLLEAPPSQINVEKVFKDLGKSEVIKKLTNSVNEFNIEADEAKSVQKAEAHVAAILFNQNNEAFCVRRTEKNTTLPGKWENGCVTLDVKYEDITELVKEYYYKSFNIKIEKFKMTNKLGYESFNLVGLYTHTNLAQEPVTGIIITGKTDSNDIIIQNKDKYAAAQWLTMDEIENIDGNIIVPGFKERIKAAYEMWNDSKNSNDISNLKN